MKFFLALVVATLATLSAKADVYVPYGQWTYLPNCGGYTRLNCEGPRRNNQCNVEFSDSYGCKTIKLYVGTDFYPTSITYTSTLKGKFWVDNAKVGWYTLSFRAYLDNNGGTPYERITYQFNH